MLATADKRCLIPVPAKPRQGISGRWRVMTVHGAAQHLQESPLPMRPLAEDCTPNEHCRVSQVFCRWTAMPIQPPDRKGPCPSCAIRLAYCWAHARRKLAEITRTGSAPVAEDAVKRIGELYRVEAELRSSPDVRLAEREKRSTPLIADMRTWPTHHRARVTDARLGRQRADIRIAGRRSVRALHSLRLVCLSPEGTIASSSAEVAFLPQSRLS
ncbi:hypothetical protein CUJ84_pRLN3000360 (plasmid) [Rhizobium leguminosarum]|uniref:Transposase IS66 central domain-containing protein n=1 Tax=Rhizobium leguminosarum TaxID=384 RepID=A0A2K9ZGV1_RHILE|nr:hypothetical protein CUJ84_pRLN3000360 [Rhizobium leguminosarum]